MDVEELGQLQNDAREVELHLAVAHEEDVLTQMGSFEPRGEVVEVVRPKWPVAIVEPRVVKDVEVIESLVFPNHVSELGGLAHEMVVEAHGNVPPVAEHTHVSGAEEDLKCTLHNISSRGRKLIEQNDGSTLMIHTLTNTVSEHHSMHMYLSST